MEETGGVHHLHGPGEQRPSHGVAGAGEVRQGRRILRLGPCNPAPASAGGGVLRRTGLQMPTEGLVVRRPSPRPSSRPSPSAPAPHRPPPCTVHTTPPASAAPTSSTPRASWPSARTAPGPTRSTSPVPAAATTASGTGSSGRPKICSFTCRCPACLWPQAGQRCALAWPPQTVAEVGRLRDDGPNATPSQVPADCSGGVRTVREDGRRTGSWPSEPTSRHADPSRDRLKAGRVRARDRQGRHPATRDETSSHGLRIASQRSSEARP